MPDNGGLPTALEAPPPSSSTALPSGQVPDVATISPPPEETCFHRRPVTTNKNNTTYISMVLCICKPLPYQSYLILSVTIQDEEQCINIFT